MHHWECFCSTEWYLEIQFRISILKLQRRSKPSSCVSSRWTVIFQWYASTTCSGVWRYSQSCRTILDFCGHWYKKQYWMMQSGWEYSSPQSLLPILAHFVPAQLPYAWDPCVLPSLNFSHYWIKVVMYTRVRKQYYSNYMTCGKWQIDIIGSI